MKKIKTLILVFVMVLPITCLYFQKTEEVNASSTIETDGLIGYWHYKEGVHGSTWDNIAPSTKGSSNGIITGATLQSDGVSFDGIDDKVVIQQNAQSTQMTLEVVYKVTNMSSHRTLINATDSNNIPQLGLRLVSSGHFGVGYRASTGNFYNIYPTTIETNTITMFTGVVDTTTQKIKYYKNGIYFGENYMDSNALPQINFSKMVFGRWSETNVTNPFYGKIMSVKVYNRKLNDSEIFQNYSLRNELALPPSPFDTTILRTGIKSGGIHIDYQESTPIDLGDIVTDGTKKTLTTLLDNVLIQDHMGTGNGWTLTLEASPFTEVITSGGSPIGLSLPSGSVTYKGILSSSQTISTKLTTDSVIDSGSPIVIAIAGINEGIGDTTITHQNPGVELEIDTKNRYVNPNNLNASGATPYQSVFTWNVSAGP